VPEASTQRVASFHRDKSPPRGKFRPQDDLAKEDNFSHNHILTLLF